MIALLLALAPAALSPAAYRGWQTYGGAPDNIRYSTLTQINRTNASKLEAAWTFDTGDAAKNTEMECNPIVVGRTLYATTPKLRVIALDAATGKLLWRFDPEKGKGGVDKPRSRGLTYANGHLYFVARHFLYSLDARTGHPVPSFGSDGRVDLREGLGRDVSEINISATSPGVVYKDLLILGSIVSETLPSSPGDIRAFDLATGKMRWIFHTIPHPGEFGYDTWPKDAWQYIGGANNWPGMSVDEKRGLVFAGTGSAAFDFYGANRAGDDLFANTLLALKADTGERVWHFQAVKHDLWDRDFPAPPSLVTVEHDGHPVDAVAQITKSGFVFLFERETGKPLFPIEYRPVPTDGVDGEALAPTQPFPLKPPPFARQIFTESMATNRTPEARQAVLDRLRKVRSAGQFVPPSLQGTVVFPGFDGGGEWGGAAFDPETGLLYVNSNEMAWILRLVERRKSTDRRTGRSLYLRHCASCHRDDFRGTPPEFPSLIGIANRRLETDVAAFIRGGGGRMPAFAHLGSESVDAIARWVYSRDEREVLGETKSRWPLEQKYTHDGYNKFLDPDGYPAVEPPWGTLNAIDLNKGEIAWKIPLGGANGSENYGGPVVTAGGVIFIAATVYDKKFHVFDKSNGKLLWETTLPASGTATPATYEVDGKQFVVIAAGGGKWGAPSGGTYVAFALP